MNKWWDFPHTATTRFTGRKPQGLRRSGLKDAHKCLQCVVCSQVCSSWPSIDGVILFCQCIYGVVSFEAQDKEWCPDLQSFVACYHSPDSYTPVIWRYYVSPTFLLHMLWCSSKTFKISDPIIDSSTAHWKHNAHSFKNFSSRVQIHFCNTACSSQGPVGMCVVKR